MYRALRRCTAILGLLAAGCSGDSGSASDTQASSQSATTDGAGSSSSASSSSISSSSATTGTTTAGATSQEATAGDVTTSESSSSVTAGTTAATVTGTTGTTGGVGIVSSVAAGDRHSCAVVDGRVYCWGRNQDGQLGDGTSEDRLTPTPVESITEAVALAAGGAATCASVFPGDLYCWGSNEWGQLGNNSQVDSPAPAQVLSIGHAERLAAGAYHGCAVEVGLARCWGANEGRLGNGENALSEVPVDMLETNGVVGVAAGWGHSCARLDDGRVRCSGTYNAWGQLGDGTSDDTLTPVDVLGLTEAEQITAGLYHTCALLPDATIVCWGNNQNGQLGQGISDQDVHGSPEPVPGLTNVVEVRAGGFHTCARLGSGEVACWGSGPAVGVPLGEWSYAPTMIAGVDDAVALAGGGEHNCVALGSGGVACWGANESGQLGDGTTDDRTSAAAVVGLP